MSTLPALASRSLPASLYAANLPNDAKTSASTAARQVKAGDALTGNASSTSSVSNSLEQHVAAVGNDTVDFAQSFLNSFAQSLFGTGGKDAQISFDSASLDTSSTVAAGVRQSGGAQGSSAAAFQLTDSSHFIGKGTITTADGRKFDFEVEVQYDAQLSAAASRAGSSGSGSGSSSSSGGSNSATSDAGSANSQLLDSQLTSPTRTSQTDKATGSNALTSSTAELPTVQVPNIDFPGTLSDLFKLIGLDLQSALSTGDTSPAKTSDGIDRNTLRSLSLRLLNLVNSKDTNTYSAPSAADKAKAAAASATDSGTASSAGTNTGTNTSASSTNASTTSSAAAPAISDSDQDGDSDARQSIADLDA